MEEIEMSKKNLLLIEIVNRVIYITGSQCDRSIRLKKLWAD